MLPSEKPDAIMKIAFLILAHGDPTHLERLCRALTPHAVFVHIDARANDFPTERLAASPNVTVVTPRVEVHWGDFSMVEATLALLNAAREEARFDRYVLLSGACYPVKPMAALETALDSEREWIALTPITQQSHLRSLIGRRWRMAPFVSHRVLDTQLRSAWNKIAKILGRDLQREIGVPPYFGSQWWALSEPCVAAIVTFVQEHPAFVRAYRSIYAPDEHFFQTVVAASPFAAAAIQVEDRGPATNNFAPLHLIAPTSDRYFESSEAEFVLAAQTPKFFIRKVSTERSAALLDRIDRDLLHSGSI